MGERHQPRPDTRIIEQLRTAEGMELPRGGCAWVIDKGLRSKQEDRLLVIPDQTMFISIDGVHGGGKGADTAQVVARTLQQEFNNKDQTHFAGRFKKAIINALNVFEGLRSQGGGFSDTSGACVTGFAEWQDTLHIGHIGDARLVVWNKNQQVAFRTQDEENHQGTITRAVAIAFEDEIRYGHVTQEVSLAQLDAKLLICATDGLWNFLTIEAVNKKSFSILNAVENRNLSSSEKAKKIANELKQEAIKVMKKHNEGDNITVIVRIYQDVTSTSESGGNHQSSRRVRWPFRRN